jgi:hypothetical protein
MRKKAEQGIIYPSAAPVGYCNVAGSRDKRTIEPDPTSAPIIRRLFEVYAIGTYSLRDLTKKAYEDGLRSRSGTKMARRSIHTMISNPIYYGGFVWTGKHYRGVHEPLITKDLLGRYVYYHCTGNKGKCPEKYVREEELARQFGEALRAIQLDDEVLSWIVTALKREPQGMTG